MQKTVEFGELIEAVFDEAAQFSVDPREVACLATQTIVELVWRAPKPKRPRPSRLCN